MNYFTAILLLCCAALVKETRGAPADAGSSSGSSVRSKARVGYLFQGEKHVKFYLHNHDDSNNPHKMKFNATINLEWVNFEWKTVVFIHGWRDGNRFAEVMKNAYLDVTAHEVNFIKVDWLKGAFNLLYCPSAKRVPDVGETVAKFIGLNQEKFNLEKLIIVGNDLGAHVAGFAGKFLQSNYKFKPQLIVGLDPAGPCFNDYNTKKLQPTDAKNVLVIHTSEVFGHLEPLGTFDVYINGNGPWKGTTHWKAISSFAEVKNDILPKTVGIPLFHGAPVPYEGALMYVGTGEQPHIIAGVKEYIDSKLVPVISKCCPIM